MRKRRGLVAGWVLLTGLALAAPAMAEEPAQPADTPSPTEEPAQPADTPPSAEEPAQPADTPPPAEEPVAELPPDPTREKMPFALYVEAAWGSGSADPYNTSIKASDLNAGHSTVEIVDASYGRAAIGWKLPRGKGDFRLNFQGFMEEEYEFRSVGATNRTADGSLVDSTSGLVPWWFIEINGGKLIATRLAPTWDSAADVAFGDMDGKPDFGSCAELPDGRFRCGEVTYDPSMPLKQITGSMPDDLQNRVDTYEIVYGREFGGRRYSSRWWAGLRYFEYEGNLLAGAWLNSNVTGLHYTDGSFLRLLNITQRTTGAGPVGSWEVDFNYFERALQLYLRGEAAFTLNNMEIDSGPFFQVKNVDAGLLMDDRMFKSQEKSSWQDRAEVGARLYLKNGMHFEVAYSITGFLDVALLPDLLQLGVTNEDPETFTQDLVIEALHVGAGFQF